MMIQEKNEQLQAEKRRTESMKSKVSTQRTNVFRIAAMFFNPTAPSVINLLFKKF